MSQKKKKKENPSYFERLERYLEPRQSRIFGIAMAVAVLLSFLLFDPKINMMGDDSDYLHFGYRFAHDFQFPALRGALYPMVLSPFIAIFGMKIVLFKILSALMLLASLYFLYKALFRRVPNAILFACLVLLAVNGYLLLYSSAILSEPLFMLLQSLLIYVFCRYFIDVKEFTLKQSIRHLLLLAFLTLCLTLTRTVGYAAVGIVAVYFLIERQWRNAALSVAAHGVMFVAFDLLKKLLWPTSGGAYQLNTFFYKDFYSPGKGYEDAVGLIRRMFVNMNNYLSKNVSDFLGLKSSIYSPALPSTLLTGLFVVLFVVGGYFAFRKNKALFFTALYVLGFCVSNFFMLHANWQQERFMIAFFPILLPILLAAFYYLLQPYAKAQFLYLLLVIAMFCSTLHLTGERVSANSTTLGKALGGDVLYGLSPDWQNYILMSKWAAANTPDSLNIAVRKPSTSTIYTNRDFVGIARVPNVMRDSLNAWQPAPDKTALVVNISAKNPIFIAPDLKYVWRGKIALAGDSALWCGIYEIDNNYVQSIEETLKQNNFAFSTDYAAEKQKFYASADNLIYSPDEMLNSLKNNNVHYMILASLRLNPYQYTGNIINTLHNYLAIMSMKYYNVASEKHTIGTKEPASLIELKY